MPRPLRRLGRTVAEKIGRRDATQVASSATTVGVESLESRTLFAAYDVDFNGDGNNDLAWRNYSTGASGVWFMNSDGSAKLGAANLLTTADTNWQICGAGDFNNDGTPDLFWHHATTAANGIWYMGGSDGTTRIGTANVQASPTTDWQPGTVDDFNLDGTPDIVWRNAANGQNGIWFMGGSDGTTRLSAQLFANTVADTSWVIGGAGDFDDDGHTDLLWHNILSGQAGIWFFGGSDGTTRLDARILPFTPPSSWVSSGAQDLNGDGNADIIWRNASTGENGVWYMDGTTRLNAILFQTVADTDWQIVGAQVF